MTRPSLPESADILIVGAGLAAAATAHALAASGRGALLIERRLAPGAEASGRSASMIREDVRDEALAELVAEGASLHRSGTLAPFRRTGSFLLGRGEDELSRHVPIARGLGRFFPDDGVVDTELLLRSLLAGVPMVVGVQVEHIEPNSVGDGLMVVTDAGTVHARIVVNAAGAWAGRLGGLPLESRKRHLFVSEPCGASGDWPFTWDDESGYYFRPQGDSLLLCPCDERVREPGDNAVEPRALEELRQKLARFQPTIPPLAIRDSWAGQRTFAADGRFVVGWDPRFEGLFWLAGLGGHGVTASPALGRLAASMLLAGQGAETPARARSFRPARLMAPA